MPISAKSRPSVVLVATDLTPQSRGALRFGAALARASNAKLVVLHVVELPERLKIWNQAAARTHLLLYRRLVAAQVADALTELKSHLASVLGASHGARAIARAGWVVQTVAEVADSTRADLVVVARGRGGELGRNAEGVVRLRGRAVLVAPIRALPFSFLTPPAFQRRRSPVRKARAA